jgi:proteasome lid subunit RPN8/RPN11
MIDFEDLEDLIEKGAIDGVREILDGKIDPDAGRRGKGRGRDEEEDDARERKASKYYESDDAEVGRSEEAKRLLLLGIIEFREGSYRESMDHLTEALEIAEKAGPKKLTHRILNYLVWIGLKAGLQRSNHAYMRKLEEQQDELSGIDRAFFFTNHAYAVSLDMGFIESERFSDRLVGNALRALKKAEKLSPRKDPVVPYRAMLVKGMIYQQKENWNKARDELEDAYKDIRKEHYPFLEADLCEELGNLHYREGLNERCVDREGETCRELLATGGIWFSKALDIWEGKGRDWEGRNRDQKGILLASIGEIRYLLGEFDRAEVAHKAALEIFEELDYRHGIAGELDALGRVNLRLGELKIRKEEETNESGSGRGGFWKSTPGQGEVKQGIKLLKKALKIFRKLDVRHEALLTRVHLVDGYFLLSPKKGKHHLKKLIFNEPVKRYIDCYRELKEVVLREEWLREDPDFEEMFEKPSPKYITIELLEQIIEAAKRGHPNEFGALIHGDPVMDRLEFVLDSARGSDTFMFSLYNRYSGDYISADGSVHSHPSGAAIPSKADLSFFGKFPNVNIIIGYPYAMDSWAAYDRNGNRQKVDVIYREHKEQVEAMVKKLDGKKNEKKDE